MSPPDGLLERLRSPLDGKYSADYLLSRHPEATIVSIGCGLDTTFDQIDNGSLVWYDLDLANVISLRRTFHEMGGRKSIRDSFIDRGWLKDKVLPTRMPSAG